MSYNIFSMSGHVWIIIQNMIRMSSLLGDLLQVFLNLFQHEIHLLEKVISKEEVQVVK